MSGPLDIAIVWHMHQPYYRQSDTGAYEMPWVRMHAVKDYARLVRILDEFPHIHQTFNLVPSLVEQLLDYEAGDYADTFERVCRTPAHDLTEAERRFLLETVCERTGHPRVRSNPRYLELAEKRDRCTTGRSVRAGDFTIEEVRDLQVWFDLAWSSHDQRMSDPLADLFARGRDFSEDDKGLIAEVQAAAIRDTIPAYRAALDDGRIEISTSPYFHPILPLLANTDIARVSRPGTPLPTRRFAHAEDAAEQVLLGAASHRSVFGREPRGVWCSEMGVGEDVIPMLCAAGIDWTISDEGVLARSLGRTLERDHAGRLVDPALMYSAYRLDREGSSLDIVFRDRVLSDLIGFTYQPWDPADAAADLLRRLHDIRRSLADTGNGRLVTIALDGENAWEHYRADGREFLTRLYEGLSDDTAFRCVTVSEHLDAHPPAKELPWLHSGSWIGADFGTWIGDRAHRPSWDMLHDARDAVARAARPDPAWREILIAEGSDWLWWFSDHQDSGVDHVWDAAFRRHLQQAYRLAGLRPPPVLFAPILPEARGLPDGAVTPTLDGAHTHPEEWSRAIRLRSSQGGTMQRGEGGEDVDLRFGWDAKRLYVLLAIESATPTSALGTHVEVALFLEAVRPDTQRETPTHPLGLSPTHRLDLRSLVSDRIVLTEPVSFSALDPVAAAAGVVDVAEGSVLEVAVPLSALAADDRGAPVAIRVAAEISTPDLLRAYPATGLHALTS